MLGSLGLSIKIFTIIICFFFFGQALAQKLNPEAQQILKNEESEPSPDSENQILLNQVEVENKNNQICLSVIVVSTAEKANELKRQLNEGADFAELARNFSIGPKSNEGGYIGYVAEDGLIPQVLSAIKSIDNGEISDIIKTPAGFFIINKINERQKGKKVQVESFAILFAQGQELYNERNYQEATESFSKAVELKPDDKLAHAYLAHCLVISRIKDDSDILEIRPEILYESSYHFEKAIELSPEFELNDFLMSPYDNLTSIWGSLALSHAAKGKNDSCRWAFAEGKKRGGFYDALLEYNRNILASCKTNSVLITNGQNDTYPLWYLQYIEKYRTDVTVLDINFLKLSWYPNLLDQNYPFGASLNMGLNSTEIDSIIDKPWPASQIEIPINNDPLNPEGKIVASPLQNNPYQYLKRQDQILLKIINKNNWLRPIYFSTTHLQINPLNFSNYLSLEGIVFKLNSHEPEEPSEEIIYRNLFNTYTYTTLSSPMFKYNPTILGMLNNYRISAVQLAYYFLTKNLYTKSIDVIAKIDSIIEPQKLKYRNDPISKERFRILIRAYKAVEDSISRNNIIKEATEFYSLEIDASPYDYNNYMQLADILRWAGQYNNAIAFYQKVTTLRKDFATAHYYLGLCHHDLNEYEEAIKYLELAIEERPRRTLYLNAMALAYFNKNDFAMAVHYYKKTLDIDPENINALGNLGWTYYEMGEFENCITYSQQAVNHDNKAFYAKYNIALCLLRLNNIEQAYTLYEKIYKEELEESNETWEGAIEDLDNLKREGILVKEVGYILSEIFHITN